MALSRTISILSYVFWATALVLYGLSIWGSLQWDGFHVLELSKNFTSVEVRTVSTQLGFYNLCISPHPSEGTSRNETSRACVQASYYHENSTKQELVEDFLRHLEYEDDNNLSEEGPGLEGQVGKGYRSILGQLLYVARDLHEEDFAAELIVTAFALLLLAGLLLVMPLFFNHSKRHKLCLGILGVSALLLSFGFMGAGAAVFTTLTTQKLLIEGIEGLADSGSDGIVISQGSLSSALLIAALTTNGIFLLSVTITAYARSQNNETFEGIQILQWVNWTWRPWPSRVPKRPTKTYRPIKNNHRTKR